MLRLNTNLCAVIDHFILTIFETVGTRGVRFPSEQSFLPRRTSSTGHEPHTPRTFLHSVSTKTNCLIQFLDDCIFGHKSKIIGKYAIRMTIYEYLTVELGKLELIIFMLQS